MAYLYKATAEPMWPVISEAVCVFYTLEDLPFEDIKELAQYHMAGVDIKDDNITYIGEIEIEAPQPNGIICREVGNY